MRLLQRFHSAAAKRCALACVLAGLLVTPLDRGDAQTIIVGDSFQGSNGAAIAGRLPNLANLPGGAWTVQPFHSGGNFGATVSTTAGTPSPSAKLNCAGNSSGSVAIRLGSAGSYTKPTRMTLSADLVAPGSTEMLLGFYSALPVQASGHTVFTYFTGLSLDHNSGEVTLFENGASVAVVAYTGTFAANTFHRLSFTVDTNTGNISEVSLDGSSSAYTFASAAFTPAATAYVVAGAWNYLGRDKAAYADNLQVLGIEAEPVPETVTQDAFGGSNGAAVAGRAPDTANLPGTAWTLQPFHSGGSFSATISTAAGVPVPSAKLNCAGNSSGSVAVRIASAGSYVKPSKMTLSASLQSVAGSTEMLLGFYSSLPVQASGHTVLTHFTGLSLDHNSGELSLVENGLFVDTVAYGGTFVPNTFHRLSFCVDTANGSIGGVQLEGSSSVYDFSSTAFTDAATTHAVVGAWNYFNRDKTTYADNVQLRSGWSANDPELNPFGISSSAYQAGRYTAWMPSMASARVKWARLFPEWNTIQPNSATFNFAPVDAQLAAAASNGLNVSGIFMYNASWVNANTHTFPTNNLSAWSNYVHRVVEHCAGRVQYWEVWNEPEAFSSGGSPAGYAAVVAEAYRAAKSADPSCRIGITFTDFNLNWTKRALTADSGRMKDQYDFVCFHPYSILGAMKQGWEGAYLGVVGTTRKMLASVNPARANAPVWFTELGQAVQGTATEDEQADGLVKSFAMGIAQGVSRIDWYEAKDGDAGPFGLLDAAGAKRKAWYAMQSCAAHLGANPVYLGWVLLNQRDYGFVFDNGSVRAMALWAPPGVSDPVSFPSAVQLVDPRTGSVSNLPANAAFTLTNAPKIVAGVPASVVATALANKTVPFPWGGDYTSAPSVNVAMGATNTDSGLHLLNAAAFAASQVGGSWCRDMGASNANAYMVDPNFLSYTPRSIRIDIQYYRKPGKSAGFNLKYEGPTGWKSMGWYTLTDNSQWNTLSITVNDPEFVGCWAYNFRLDSDSTTYSNYYVRKVTVTKL